MTTLSPRTTRLSFAGIVRGERIKLLSVRSAPISTSLLILLTAAVATAMAFGIRSQESPSEIALPLVIFSGLVFTQLVVASHGVVTSAGEFATGQSRSTVGSVQRRGAVLLAKAAVFAVYTFATSLVALSAAGAIGVGVLGLGPADDLGATVRVIAGAAGYLTVVGLIALFVGQIVRSTAGGIAIAIALLLVLPVALSTIPVDWAQDLADILPSTSAQVLYLLPIDTTVDAVRELAITGAWLVGTGIAAAIASKRDL